MQLRVAVPIYRKRISPVLDFCERLLVVDLVENSEVERKEVFLDEMSLSDRLTLLQRLEVTMVICGGISDTLYHMLQNCGIESISGITGDVEDVITAFCRNQLNDSKFMMPGCNFRE
ncbi:MAG: NifB/NifX family molybdenum-iron cluster-binding protein [Deltaproteobacteria bacterium]|nr:NifB/NifX family molybdenum-iron cluster-binding protein [Deltaproteobacteria bacterium]